MTLQAFQVRSDFQMHQYFQNSQDDQVRHVLATFPLALSRASESTYRPLKGLVLSKPRDEKVCQKS